MPVSPKTPLHFADARRELVTKLWRRYQDPFVKKDPGEERALLHEKDLLQKEIAREASRLLKEGGFRADGEKRKRR